MPLGSLLTGAQIQGVLGLKNNLDSPLSVQIRPMELKELAQSYTADSSLETMVSMVSMPENLLLQCLPSSSLCSRSF